MKPYFAKYLPIEGEIKEGDIVLIKGILQFYFVDRVKETPSEKYKLFLCGRDIQIGDYIHGLREGGWDTEHQGIALEQDRGYFFIEGIIEGGLRKFRLRQCFKVIGEISPEAKVQEGDEFDYGEVLISYCCEKGDECDKHFGEQLCSAPHEILNLIKIKCPWGHFH